MSRILCTVTIALLTTSPLLAQPEVEAQQDFDRMAREQQVQQRVDKFMDLGLEREAATFLTLLSESGMDPSQIVLMMMMAEHGGDEMLPLMMMRNQQGASAPAAVIDRGEELLIVEGGTLYVIDMQNMEIKSKLKYAQPERLEDTAVFSLLAPMITGARGDAQRTACMSNLKQIGLAFMMYAEDHDGALPAENWVAEVLPYINNRQIFVCPARPNLPVGYAVNEKVAGMDLNVLEAPAQTVLAFESNLDGDAPIGGADAVPMEGVHDGRVNVVFVDGHVEFVPVEEATDLLARPVE